MSFLLNPRVWIAMVLAGLLAASHFTVYRWGKQHVKAEWVASVAAANAEALRLERAHQSRVDEAARTAAAREAGLRASAARAGGERDGMRDDLLAAREYAKKSRAAAERIAGIASDLFGRCTARYTGVAEAAQRADSEARELRQGWPR